MKNNRLINSHYINVVYMLKEIDVLIFIEHKDREMDGTKAIVSRILENYNYSIVVTNTEFGFYDAYVKYIPRVLCLPYCRGKKNHIANAFYRRNPKTVILNLNYEQLYNKLTTETKKPQDRFATKILKHIAWGENFKKYLISHGVDSRNIFVTGKPEIHFLKLCREKREELRKLLSEDFGIPLSNQWIFLPLNDGMAFWSEERIVELIKKKRQTPQFLEYHRIQKKQLLILLNYISSASKVNKNVSFILRPHPGVQFENYIEFCKSLDIDIPHKLHIIRNYTIKEWISCSDICISNWSTSIIDSISVGVPTFVFEPEVLPAFMQADWIDAFPKIVEYQDFEEALQSNYIISKEIISFINDYIDTQLNPIEEYAKVICSLKNENSSDKVIYLLRNLGDVPYMLRSKLRKISCKYQIFDSKIKNAIKYDYFDEFRYNV